MADNRRQVLVYFGKRDDEIWKAIDGIPKGDRNYHMKEAFRMYFLGQAVKEIERPALPIAPDPPDTSEEKEDYTDKINIDKLSGLMIR